MLEKLLKGFMVVWLVLVFLLNVASVAGLVLKAPSVWAWLGEVASMYAPWSIGTYFINMVLLSPAICAAVLQDKMAKQRGQKV